MLDRSGVLSRIFDSQVLDVFSKISEAVGKLKVGDPTNQILRGPLISEKECQRVADWVQEAIDGGVLAREGKISELPQPTFYRQTKNAKIRLPRYLGRLSVFIHTMTLIMRLRRQTVCL